jgi:predicted metal-dependent peptidase
MKPGVDPVTKEQVTQADWAQKATQAAQVARNMGKLPAEIERALGMGMKAQVDWASELSRFMDSKRNDDYSWQHFDRRHTGRGIYLPDMHSEGMGAIALIVDTSGSVDDTILNRMANEIQAIASRLKPDKIVVIYCDADVQREEIFKPGDLIQLHPKGGGGTDFRPAFEHVSREHPDIVVCAYFTDGYGTFPAQEPTYPVMWLTYGLDAKDYPFGHVVPVTI